MIATDSEENEASRAIIMQWKAIISQGSVATSGMMKSLLSIDRFIANFLADCNSDRRSSFLKNQYIWRRYEQQFGGLFSFGLR